MPAVEFREVSIRFPNGAGGYTQACDRVSFSVRPGSIHAVIGENGAGKSTAMKMLYGMHAPDSGVISVSGTPAIFRSPVDAIAAGIGMVHQHFMLAGPYSVLDNILLGAEGVGPLRAIPRARAKAKLDSIARAYGLPVPWDEPVERLPVGLQQRAEILKTLYREARILILDEPTAVLTPQEVDELFVQLSRMRSEGKTVILITHKLREVLAVSDRVTVFRAGQVVGEQETPGATAEELAERMVGRKLQGPVRREIPGRVGEESAGEPALLVKGLEAPGLDDLSLEVRRGEILGVAGVDGNGQAELLRSLLFPSFRRGGLVRVLGTDTSGLATRDLRRLGVGSIPEDRHRDGLLLDRPVYENFLLGYERGMRLSRGQVRRDAALALEEFDIRPRTTELAMRGLSGGNQQKLVVARETRGSPGFLIAGQPTRGVDVGAIERIHGCLLDLRAAGTGILLVSSELDEILALSDRVVVLYRGRIVGRLARADLPGGALDEKRIGALMAGVGDGK